LAFTWLSIKTTHSSTTCARFGSAPSFSTSDTGIATPLLLRSGSQCTQPRSRVSRD
jgi:hypothetical protein